MVYPRDVRVCRKRYAHKKEKENGRKKRRKVELLSLVGIGPSSLPLFGFITLCHRPWLGKESCALSGQRKKHPCLGEVGTLPIRRESWYLPATRKNVGTPSLSQFSAPQRSAFTPY